MEKVDFSKFGKTFQEDLAQLIVEDRSFSDQMQELLNFDFFEFRYLQKGNYPLSASIKRTFFD